MPKTNQLQDLQNLLAGEQSLNKDYFLFMLGTDTVFTPKPTAPELKYYDNGETLSYAAQVVASRLGENVLEIDPQAKPDEKPHPSLAFSTHSIDVVNGPTTLGKEVGERVAQGVFLCLRALATGKTTVEIAAHSRGAVESILIAHELQRILDELQKNADKSLYQILQASPCSYTKTAFKAFFKEASEPKSVRDELGKRLASAKINLFLMDPVPGGRYRFVPGTAWRDERFYIKPKICNKVDLMLCRDERTRCFIPVVPNGLTPLLMPGHHGTLSGNIYSQQFAQVPATIAKRDTSTAQQLALTKLLHFLNVDTGLFDNNKASEINLAHPLLDRLTNVFVNGDATVRSAQLLSLYNQVHDNDSAFRHFQNTTYAYLGSEQSSSGARLVHYNGPRYIGLDSIFSAMDGKFINTEHALLFLHEHMDFSFQDEKINPDALVVQLAQMLNNLFIAYVNRDMSDSKHSKSIALLEKPEDRQATFQALSLFVDNISQKYLRNHLSKESKDALLAEIGTTFRVLGSAKKPRPDDPINVIISECEAILKKGILRTIESHYNSVIDQSNAIITKIDYHQRSNRDFPLVFQRCLTQLSSINDPLFDGLFIELSATEVDVDKVRTVISKHLDKLKEEVKQKPEIAPKIDQLIELTNPLAPYFDNSELLDDDIYQQLESIYENSLSVIADIQSLVGLIGDDSISMDKKMLAMHADRAVKLAAQVLDYSKTDLKQTPKGMSDAFYDLVKKHSVLVLAQSLMSQSNVEALAKLRQDQQTEISELQSKLNALAQRYQQELSRFEAEISTHEKKLKQKDQVVEGKVSENEDQAHLIQRLKDLKSNAEKQLQLSKDEIARLTGKQNDLNKQVDELREANQDLVAQHQLAQSNLQQQFLASLAEKVRLAAQYRSVEMELTSLMQANQTEKANLLNQLQEQKNANQVEKESLVALHAAEKSELDRQLLVAHQNVVERTQQYDIERTELQTQIQSSKTKLVDLTTNHQALEAELQRRLASSEAEKGVLLAQLTTARSELQKQQQANQAALDGLKALYFAEKSDLERQLAGRDQNYASLSKQEKDLQAQIKAGKDRMVLLEGNHLSALTALQHLLDAKHTENEGLLQQLSTLRTELQTEQTANQAAMVRLAALHLTEKNELERQLSGLNQRLKDMAQQNSANHSELDAQKEAHKSTFASLQANHQRIEAELNRQLQINQIEKADLKANHRQAQVALEKQITFLESQHVSLVALFDEAQATLSSQKTNNQAEMTQLAAQHQLELVGLRKQLQELKEDKARFIQDQNKPHQPVDPLKAVDKLQNKAREQQLDQQIVALEKQLQVKQDQNDVLQKQHQLKQADLEEQLKSNEEARAKLNQQQVDQQTDLAQQIQNLQHNINDLTATNQKNERRIHHLERVKKRQNDLVLALGTAKEVSCANLIHTQLIPMTEDYLKHLLTEAQEIDGLIDVNDFKRNLRHFDFIDKANQQKYDLLMIKHQITLDLLKRLTDDQTNPLPSERVKSFTKAMQLANVELHAHRDPAWKRYSKNCLVAIGLICTGIIPGIIALLTYANFTGKSPLFFAMSEGEKFVEQADKLTNDPAAPAA